MDEIDLEFNAVMRNLFREEPKPRFGMVAAWGPDEETAGLKLRISEYWRRYGAKERGELPPLPE